MTTLHDLREAIAEVIAVENAYNLPAICVRLGLANGDSSDAHNSKRRYVRDRLVGKPDEFLINLGNRVLNEYPSDNLRQVLRAIDKTKGFRISVQIRQSIVDELLLMGSMYGNLDLIGFLQRISELSAEEQEDIHRHVIQFPDRDEDSVLRDHIDVGGSTDESFVHVLEQVVHPVVRRDQEQTRYVEAINKHLATCGLALKAHSELQQYRVYRVEQLGNGVKGSVKNLIFAASGPKPDIILADAVSNDIRIVRNAEFCLVYDLPIPETGLSWGSLTSWWATKMDNTDNVERSLYLRLFASLASPPERLLFRAYYENVKSFGDRLPALIPRVYLHYDPYTKKVLMGDQRIPRQRMDFLILLSQHKRIVIEVDGKQHYADGEKADPKLYSEMVAADRQLKLAGYEVYRFGGYELEGEHGIGLVKAFFAELFRIHDVQKD